MKFVFITLLSLVNCFSLAQNMSDDFHWINNIYQWDNEKFEYITKSSDSSTLPVDLTHSNWNRHIIELVFDNEEDINAFLWALYPGMVFEYARKDYHQYNNRIDFVFLTLTSLDKSEKHGKNGHYLGNLGKETLRNEVPKERTLDIDMLRHAIHKSQKPRITALENGKMKLSFVYSGYINPKVCSPTYKYAALIYSLMHEAGLRSHQNNGSHLPKGSFSRNIGEKGFSFNCKPVGHIITSNILQQVVHHFNNKLNSTFSSIVDSQLQGMVDSKIKQHSEANADVLLQKLLATDGGKTALKKHLIDLLKNDKEVLQLVISAKKNLKNSK